MFWWKSLPQVSHGFGADQWEDDVIILLTLESVDCCHLQINANVHGNIQDMDVRLQQANAFSFFFLKCNWCGQCYLVAVITVGHTSQRGLIRLRGYLPSLASFLGLLRLTEKVAGREHHTLKVQRLQPFWKRMFFTSRRILVYHLV